MRWQDLRRSMNIKDRRGAGGLSGGFGMRRGGIGGGPL